MNLSLAIDINRAALLRLVAMLFEASGMVAGKPAMLPRIIRGSVLHTLRPAESAVRRLISILAKEIVVVLGAARSAPSGPIPRGNGTRAATVPLFDPRKRLGAATRRRYAKHDPRLSFFDGSDRAVEPSSERADVTPDAPVDATRLCRRLEALQNALKDLPKQAKRLARMQARRAASGSLPLRAIRPGRPPGFRERGRFEIDEILREFHQLALMALAAPDTS